MADSDPSQCTSGLGQMLFQLHAQLGSEMEAFLSHQASITAEMARLRDEIGHLKRQKEALYTKEVQLETTIKSLSDEKIKPLQEQLKHSTNALEEVRAERDAAQDEVTKLTIKVSEESAEKGALLHRVARLETEAEEDRKRLTSQFLNAQQEAAKSQKRAEVEIELRLLIEEESRGLKRKVVEFEAQQSSAPASANSNPRKRPRTSSVSEPKPRKESGELGDGSLDTKVQSREAIEAGDTTLVEDDNHDSNSNNRHKDRPLAPDFPDPALMDGELGLGRSFTRQEIGKALGGNHQAGIISNISHRNSIGVNQLACFKFEANIFAPQRPKMDGSIFVGLGKEDVIGTPENGDNVYELFVSFRPTLWTYMGTYKFQRTDPLPLEDWKTKVNELFRRKYAETHAKRSDQVTNSKGKRLSPIEVRELYDTGDLRVPRVRARYTGHFNPLLQNTISPKQ